MDKKDTVNLCDRYSDERIAKGRSMARKKEVEYSLTELGRGLQPVLESIVEWGLTGAHEEILGSKINPPNSMLK